MSDNMFMNCEVKKELPEYGKNPAIKDEVHPTDIILVKTEDSANQDDVIKDEFLQENCEPTQDTAEPVSITT